MRGTCPKLQLPRPAALLLAMLLSLFGWPAAQPLPGFTPAQAAAATPAACPNTPSTPSGPDYSNRNLSGMNFNRLDLRNANFSGATLKGTVFIGANLAGANFSNAKVVKSDNEVLRPTDFTGANLRQACFAGVSFEGRTYFSHAEVSCADFSGTALVDGLTIFGPAPLAIDASLCKPAFRGTLMNCEFINDWPKLDFGPPVGNPDGAGTNFSACVAKLAGLALPDADLRGANLQNANLVGAKLRNARLQGASLVGANLSGADLSDALLSNEQGGSAANLFGAHLRDVNLARAKLSGVDFSFADFYSSMRGPCSDNNAGKRCSSARGATMTGTIFSNAFLYGVDFSGATIVGANFSQAVLTGASFADATIVSDSNGTRTSFVQAHLEGADLGNAALIRDASLAYAYVDFNPDGNLLYAALDGSHSRHACPQAGCPVARGASVCVALPYDGGKKLPQSEPSIACPSGQAQAAGCGPTNRNGSNPAWKSAQPLTSPAAWYARDATYTPAAAAGAICNGKGAQSVLADW